MQISNFGNVLRKLVQLKCITDGSLGAGAPSCRRLWGSGGEAPSRWAIFCNFLEKKAILMPLDHISQVFRAI